MPMAADDWNLTDKLRSLDWEDLRPEEVLDLESRVNHGKVPRTPRWKNACSCTSPENRNVDGMQWCGGGGVADLGSFTRRLADVGEDPHRHLIETSIAISLE